MNQSLLFLFMILGLSLNAQVNTYPLSSNPVLEYKHFINPDYIWGETNTRYKWGRKDTIALPFFDDFSQSNVYPDSSRWLQNQVFVNAQFPIDPPSINVATFDALDPTGRPYNNTINRFFKGPGDSLMSQSIAMTDTNGNLLFPSDSVYFSFYYQPNGLGYNLSDGDSLRLFFRARNGNWVLIWSISGHSGSKPFRQVMIPIKDSVYFYKGFQFMFTTWTKQVGNANQWHVDYVYLNKNRSAGDTFHYDHTWSSQASSLLRRYYSMPYEHFMLNAVNETADSVIIRAANLYNELCQCEAKHTERYQGNTLYFEDFQDNIKNINEQQHTEWKFDSSIVGGLTATRPMIIEREYIIQESGSATLNDITVNDKLISNQIFDDYFAHDDGTAERGFGYEHDANPSNIPGQIAYQFKLNKPDQVYAIGVFFNQSIFDVSREQFTLRIWQTIAGVDGALKDSIIYESELLTPQYINQPGRYYIHYIDTQLNLQAGNFYVGWYQSTMFNLNVGWDMNSGNKINPEEPSKFLYYDSLGTWTNRNLPPGELMIRPYVGTPRQIWASVEDKRTKNRAISFYPNPASGEVHFSEEMITVKIYDSSGKLMLEADNVQTINTADLIDGIYWLIGRNAEGLYVSSKLIIFAD